MHLAEKAPPRKRPTNEPQRAMLRGLIIDLHGRPMVPTYGSSKIKRYAYYETRKDLAPTQTPEATRMLLCIPVANGFAWFDPVPTS